MASTIRRTWSAYRNTRQRIRSGPGHMTPSSSITSEKNYCPKTMRRLPTRTCGSFCRRLNLPIHTNGRAQLLRDQSQEALRRICGQQPEGALLGCARRPNTGEAPFVALADDETVRMNGWTPNLNALHEAGHLNGSWGHNGWRDLAQLGRPTKPVVVAQADVPSVPSGRPEAIEEDQYDEPPPRRHPRPRYHEPPVYGPPAYGPPPGWIVIPSEQRAMPCLPTLLT